MKKALIAAAAVAVLALAAWLLVSRNNSMPEQDRQNAPEVPANDNSASIKKDIEGLEVSSPDGEFKAIDADLNQL